MSRLELLDLVKPVLMDGAMGTTLLAHGIPAHSCLEELNLTRPDLVYTIHKSYIDVGAKVIVTNTFGANRPRLSERGKEGFLKRINVAGVRIARKAADGKAYVLASIGPLGSIAQKMTVLDMKRNFEEQAKAILEASPDGFLVETMVSSRECEAALHAIRSLSKKAVFALVTFPNKPKNISDKVIKLTAKTLRAAGAHVLGINCVDPKETLALFKKLKACDDGPHCVRPSLGLPSKQLSPKEFAEYSRKIIDLGCQWIGGCCGTTPEILQLIQK
ncbi:MAG: homocysteine S-methyltransferase family protein [Deltaproteobacteria bacterium]|nr:MAG: homocysteine S-methyltransferase family protein [Deltaproteobacteria bacterium]